MTRLTPDEQAALTAVLDTARRRASEFLEQSYKYVALGMQSIADETLNEHLLPLKAAIELLEPLGMPRP